MNSHPFKRGEDGQCDGCRTANAPAGEISPARPKKTVREFRNDTKLPSVDNQIPGRGPVLER